MVLMDWVLNVFDDRPIKVTHCKQKKFVFWDAWQPNELINMNHDHHPSFCEVLSQKLMMNKIKNINFTQASNEIRQNASRMCIQDILRNNTTICLVSFVQKFALILYIVWLKGKYYHSSILVENASIWRILKASWFYFFGERPIKVTHCQKKNIELWVLELSFKLTLVDTSFDTLDLVI
jgi:hypothetical protein